MKELAVVGWRGGLAVLLLVVVGCLRLLRAGERRGSRLYRWRLAAWALALALLCGSAAAGAQSTVDGTGQSEDADSGQTAAAGDTAAVDGGDRYPVSEVSCYCMMIPPHASPGAGRDADER